MENAGIQETVPGEREQAIAEGRDYDLEVETYKELHQAIGTLQPLAVVTKLYVKHALARVGKKVQTAEKLNIDRRTIQRWAKAGFR